MIRIRVVPQVRVVVPVSGGKDSQSCLKLALQHYDRREVRGLFCDTQWEHPLTYAHVDLLRDLYGVRIDRVSGGSVLEKSVKHGRFPGGGARHCTEELKIWEAKKYYKKLATQQGCGFEAWLGMRSQESVQRKKRYKFKVADELYAPHEVMPGKFPKYLQAMGVMFRLPILDWSAAEVFTFLRPDPVNPLYPAGFERVGCFPCLAAGDKVKEQAFTFDDFGRQQHQRVIWIGQQIGKSVWSSDSFARKHESPQCGFCAE